MAEVSPTTFFTGGESGMVWDLSTLANLSQTIDGLTPVTAVGQSVGWVKDLSPNANHWKAAANDTTRPTYQTDANGKPYLNFNGTNQVLYALPFVPAATTDATHTVCIAFEGPSTTAQKIILGSESNATANAFLELMASNSTGGLAPAFRNDSGGGPGALPTLASVLNGTTTQIVTGAYKPGTCRLRFATSRPADGGSSAGYVSSTTGAFTGFTTLTRACLGGRKFTTPTQWFTGHIYSGFVISRFLTDAEVKNGEEWTNNRASTALLPGQTSGGSVTQVPFGYSFIINM